MSKREGERNEIPVKHKILCAGEDSLKRYRNTGGFPYWCSLSGLYFNFPLKIFIF